MRRIIVLGLVLALASGIVGAFAVSQLSGSAAAAPGTQAREDQITILASAGSEAVIGTSDYDLLTGSHAILLVGLDPLHYPASSAFQLEVVWSGANASDGSMTTRCMRLFDRTAGAPVAGSEICHTQSANFETVRLRSGPFALPPGEHEYTVQGKMSAPPGFSPQPATVTEAHIIAGWAERTR